VTNIPCFIMLVDGREKERIVGATSQEQLLGMYRRAMQMRTQSPDATAAPTTQLASASVPAAQQATVDPWSCVSGASSGNAANQTFGGTNPPPRTVTKAAPIGAREPLNDAFAHQLIGSSVRLRVDDPGGHSYGTGTIIDARSGEALVITCGHLFRDSQGKGAVMVELFSATPEGVRVVEQVPASIVDYNLDRDIGLVSIKPTGTVRVAPVASTDTLIDRGDRVTSVGCDHGKDPTALATRVTNVDRYQGPPNIEAGGAPVEGRSGGGLFNAEGQLVGVCFAADYEGNEGLYTALASIHDELDRLGLSEVYRQAGAATTAQGPAATTPETTAATPIFRGQEPPQQAMPLADANAFPTSPMTEGATVPVTSVFAVGQKVDVQGTTIGKGFAGTIKRHHMSSQRASHGNSRSHNVPGSIGMAQDPGRVFPGKRMTGHLGDDTVTTQNLDVIRVDEARQLLMIKGAIPGSAGGFVTVRPAVKVKAKNDAKGAN
jgi:hypothetical protein